MNEIQISIRTLENAKKICNIANEFKDIDIDLQCGRYVIDLHSIMGILSTDLTKPTKVIFYSDDVLLTSSFIHKMEEFIIHE